MDTDIYTGMVEGVVKSDILIICLSEPYLTSANCCREIKFGADLGKPMVVARMFRPDEDISIFMRNTDLAAPFLITSGSLYGDFKDSIPPSETWSQAFNTVASQIKRYVPKCARMDDPDTVAADPLNLWLQPIDFATDIENYAAEYVSGTRQWIAEYLEEWLVSNERVMWINGGAGTGKSMISYYVSAQPPSGYMLGSVFFCRHNDNQKSSPQKIVSTIAWDLCKLFPSLRRYVETFMAADKDGLENGRLSMLSRPAEAFESLIVGGLKSLQLAENDRTILIVIDALDECNVKSRHQLLHILTKVCSALPDHVKVFTTGRPDLDIYESMSKIDPFVLKPDSGKNVKDIEKFISVRLAQMWHIEPADILYDPMAMQCVSELLVKTEGVFIYARNACEFIYKSGAKTPSHTLEQIHLFTSGPDSVYDLIVKREFPDSASIELFQHVVGSLLAVREPVSVNTLAYVGNLDPSETGMIIAKLRSILKVENGLISVIHKSLKDYLTDASRCGSNFFIDMTAADAQLAKTCLAILNSESELYHNMGKLDASEEFTDVIPITLGKGLVYACSFWADHVSSTLLQNLFSRSSIMDALFALCVNKITNWIEAMLLLRKLSLMMPMLDNLLQTLDQLDAPADSERVHFLSQILQDAKHVLVNFRIPLLFNPLQVYDTALVWAPQGSELYKLYYHPGKCSILVGACMTWGPSTLESHTEGVLSAAFSVDGKKIISSSKDYTIKIWDVRTGECTSTITGHTSWVNSVAYAPNGQFFVSASSDKSVCIWDASSGELLRVLEGHLDIITNAVISKDSKLIVSSSIDSCVKVFDVDTGKCINTMQEPGLSIRVALSPDNKTIAIAVKTKPYPISLFALDTGILISQLSGHSDSVRTVLFSPDGKWLISGGADSLVKVWDLESQICIKTLAGHVSRIIHLAISDDCCLIASCSKDSTARVWSSSTGECLNIFKGHSNWTNGVDFSADKKHLLTCSNDNTIKLWRLDEPAEVVANGHESGFVSAVVVSEDGHWVVSGAYDKTVKIWDVKTSQCVKTLEGHLHWVNNVVLSKDVSTIVSASRDKTVKVWDRESGECIQTLIGHSDYLKAIAIFNDNKTVVSGSNDRSIRFWNVQDGACMRILLGHKSLITTVAVSQNESFLLSGSRDKTIKKWNLKTNECVLTIETDTKFLYSVKFSSDESLILAWLTNETQKFWRPKYLLEQQAWLMTGNLVENYQDATSIHVAEGWVWKGGQRHLWIPDYSTSSWDVAGNVVATVQGSKIVVIGAYHLGN
ncbi:WD40-repeat-containing domain protein [Chytriomyces sp. MP71]|nr:WD40-repeat-containing domain protein [Chytriomyces sp. MP71]